MALDSSKMETPEAKRDINNFYKLIKILSKFNAIEVDHKLKRKRLINEF